MRLYTAGVFLVCGLLLATAARAERPAAAGSGSTIVIDYPLPGSIFPPEFPPPTFLWRDSNEAAGEWSIEVTFGDGSRALHLKSPGERMRVGEIDPRAVADTNKPPELTPEQAAAHTWTPDAKTWAAIKRHSSQAPARLAISAAKGGGGAAASVEFSTSKDPVAAPIFYRDVPLMPSETKKGVIKPLAATAVPLIAWRLRDVSATSSKVLLTGMHTCANCHSFSADGKTLGIDLDGPLNDKGLYALTRVKKEMSIGAADMITWNAPNEQQPALERVGFMSQVSPDGTHVLTGLSGRAGSLGSAYYVVNFKDYRFLQVFYPTRGILAWYSRAAGHRQPLPGADDPRYVQTDGVWSPDGKTIVFARAEARDPYPPDGKLAERSNDPTEVQIQYDLYRIPFNEGRGGTPQRIEGASGNGMSNTFPKVSPDGRWIVFTKCRNGQLMRPDGKLYIVPFEGGEARLMNCNTALMNSWHSFSPNGRWMVFSSKSRTPYTQMFLTHIDENGNDSPAILIENSTAANRAVNLPEFVNIRPDELDKIEVPAVDFYNRFDVAYELSQKGDYTAAIAEWRRALELNPADARALINLANALSSSGQADAAMAAYRQARDAEPGNALAHSRLGIALLRQGDYSAALPELQRAVELDPGEALAQLNLGIALARTGQLSEAVKHYLTARDIDPTAPESYTHLGVELAQAGRAEEALPFLQKASELNPKDAAVQSNLCGVLAQRGQTSTAIDRCRAALQLDPADAQAHTNLGIALSTAGNATESLAELQRAAQLAPGNASFHSNLGAALAQQNRVEEAIGEFEQALKIRPDDGQVQLNLAIALSSTGRMEEAVSHLLEAARLMPNDAGVQGNAALALARQGRMEEAIPRMEAALRLAPDSAEGHMNLGAMYASRGRFTEALGAWRKALELDPNNVAALTQAAQLLAAGPDAALRDGAKAVELAQRAVRATGERDAGSLDTLAAAYAEAGDFPQAIRVANQALGLAIQQGNSQAAEGLRGRIALFEAHKPFRAVPDPGAR